MVGQELAFNNHRGHLCEFSKEIALLVVRLTWRLDEYDMLKLA